MAFVVERWDPATLGEYGGGEESPEIALPLEAMAPWVNSVGPVAIVDLETTGFPDSRSSEILEIGMILLDPGDSTVGVASTLVRPGRSIPSVISRITGIFDEDVRDAPSLASIKQDVYAALSGRLLVAHQADFEKSFLSREVHPLLGSARYLDTQEVLSLAYPDAPDLRLETFARLLLDREEQHRAFGDALDAACVLGEIARSAQLGSERALKVRRILNLHLPASPWRGLFEPDSAEPFGGDRTIAAGDSPEDLFVGGDDEDASDFAAFATGASNGRDEESGVDSTAAPKEAPLDGRFLSIGPSDEEPVPFEMDAIVDALADPERGARHFPGYRVREEQLQLAREFVHVLADGGVAKLEGGTGVGKSLAYLAAAIPYAVSQAEAGSREPVVLSTRTKLLQDQLLRKDIAAAARFLGYPQLRALSIKGRANYVCERRLSGALGEADDPALLDELKMDYALLEACARIRPHGEVGTVPTAVLRRHPKLRELLRSSVATRADQCSREQCSHERRCPFGQHRRALGKAHLVVANHDLLLRWPPDYPSFSKVVMDEGHEVGGVAEEVFAIRVRPEDVAERLDELFGAPVRRAQRRYASAGLVAEPDSRAEADSLKQNRRDVMLELMGLGRTMSEKKDAFGGAELPPNAGAAMPSAAELADLAATRLEHLCAHAAREGPARRHVEGEDKNGLPTGPQRDLDAEEETERAITSHVEALLGAAEGLRTAFAPENDDYVGAFENLETPYDRWSLILRPVSPGEAFRDQFLGKLESLAVVSATLFVGDDDHAALGEIGLANDAMPESWSKAVGSPFPYEQSMRVVAIEGQSELVEETAQTLAVLARTLQGRTLGLFTSLARMRETADRLSTLLAGEGIEVLLPRRASDDPSALVERFRKAKGGAVLLGARRFWQGIDVRGDDLQAVVIEKLPFDVPTELRRRRDDRLRAIGEDPFSRASLGRMLLHLKQMSGRLIRSETDRGMVVIVDARQDRRYFRRLQDAFPDGAKIEIAPRETLPQIAEELGLGEASGFPRRYPQEGID
ncbi:MAG: helicase C-terminal domain-containing protein [Myxococcota bacterium]